MQRARTRFHGLLLGCALAWAAAPPAALAVVADGDGPVDAGVAELAPRAVAMPSGDTLPEVFQSGYYTVDRTIPYAFRPISATGMPLGLSDDGEANITLPFVFRLFGVESAQLRIGNNGGILFATATGEVPFANVPLPVAGLPLAILPFWDDLDATQGDVYWEVQGSAPSRVAVIEWNQRPHFPASPGTVTFQVLLFERTHKIEFHYEDVEFGEPQWDHGMSASIGLNRDGATAVVLGNNAPVVANLSAVQFIPRRDYAFELDAFGYTSIHATGTPLDLTDDGEANIVLPFDFRFFGVESPLLRIGNNGGILFATTTGDVPVTNAPLPVAGLPPAILPFWDDLDSQTGNVYWQVSGTAPFRRVVIEWYQRRHYLGPPDGHVTFQARLYELTGAIVFLYLDTEFGNPALDFGASATVGLSLDADVAVEHSYNTTVVVPGRAIVYMPVLLADYADRASLDLGSMGFPCEAFAGTTMAAGTATPFAAPLDAGTGSAAFPVGAIVPGIRFSDDPINDSDGGLPLGLAVTVPPFAGTTQTAVLADRYVDAFVIEFFPPVIGVGMDLVSLLVASALDIEFFDAAGQLVGAYGRQASVAGRFLGVISPKPIARARLRSTANVGEGVANICFAPANLIFRNGFE
jgi:hypothetical protein